MDEEANIELRNHETLGLYACMLKDGVKELGDWLEERGIHFNIVGGSLDIPCGSDECALIFGKQNPSWVRGALEDDGYDVTFALGVLGFETDYPPPLDSLLRLGDAAEQSPDYAGMGFAPEHVTGLIHMAVDTELHDAVSDDPRIWAPVHAWRVLGMLRAQEAVKPLIGLLWRIEEFDDEWISEEVPDVLADIGAAALAPLFDFFDDEQNDEQARNAAADAVGRIGRRHPECRSDCVRGLTNRLTRFDGQESGINAFLILSLVDLKAVESLAVIEAAFAAGQVDLMVLGDVEDVRIALGVQPARTTPHPRARLSDIYEEHHESLEEAAPGVGNMMGRLGYGDVPEPYIAPEKIGRNDPCPCGSCKKYKKCCGK